MKYEIMLYDIEIQLCKDNLHDAKRVNNKPVVERLEKRLDELIKEKEELSHSDEINKIRDRYLELD